MSPEKFRLGQSKEKTTRNKVELLFQGQGTCRVGMGLPLFESNTFAKKMWEKADALLEFPISQMAFFGPSDQLLQTKNAQPAIVVNNYICSELLEKEGIISPNGAAGHSLGELSSIANARVLSFEPVVLLAKERGKLMQEASEINPGGMIAVKLADTDEKLFQLMEKFNLEKSLINTNDQTALAGREEDLVDALSYAKEKGVVATRLPEIMGAYHSSLMSPAVEGLKDFIAKLHFKKARYPVIANTTARYISTPDEFRQELVDQLTHTVLWRDTLALIARSGTAETREIGEKNILTKMMQKVNEGKGRVEESVRSFIEESGPIMRARIRRRVEIYTTAWRLNPQPAATVV